MSFMWLYHYTGEDGINGIRASQKILKSATGAFGPGVYFTDLASPHHDSCGISDDCFGVNLPDRLAYAVRVRLPVNKLTHHSRQRHIWTFCEDVQLHRYQHEILTLNTEAEAQSCIIL